MKSPPSTSYFRHPWFLLALLFWVFVVFVEFFIQCPEAWLTYHFSLPVGPIHISKLLEAWGRIGSTLVICAWVFLLLLWTGKKTLGVLPSIILDPSIRFCVEAGVGLFVWNLFWVGFGLPRLWYAPVWLGAIVLVTLVAIPDLYRAVKTFKKPQTELPGWFLLLTGLYGLLALFNVLSPENFYDTLNYFLGVPQYWLHQHGLAIEPGHLKSGYFYAGSMYFMAGWLLADTEGATVLNLMVWALCGALAYGWAKELGDRKAAVVAAAAVLTFPLFYLNIWAVRVDALFAFIALLFLYALTQAMKGKEHNSWLVLAALFAGLSIAVKPTAVVVVVAAGLVLLLRRDKFIREQGLSFCLWTLVLGVLTVGPWFLKNWVFEANPLFPYGCSWLGGTVWEHGYQRLLHENRQFLPMNQGFWSILNLPWRLSMPAQGDEQMIGPLVLAFLPVLFFLKLKETQKFLLWVTVVAFALGLYGSHMLRFSMPALLLSVLLISTVLVSEEAPVYWKWSWKVSVWFFAVFFMGAYAVISAQYYQCWGLWTGEETPSAYRTRMISNSYEPIVTWVDQNLPAEARLLIVGDARGLYYPRQFRAGSVFDEPFLAEAARQEKDAAGILRRLHENGIDFIVVNGSEGLRLSKEYDQYDLTQDEWAELNELMAEGLHPVYWKNFQGVYAVKDHLSSEKGASPMNLFSLLSPWAYDFSEALKADDKPKARQALDSLLTLFPAEDYWREQSQHLH